MKKPLLVVGCALFLLVLFSVTTHLGSRSVAVDHGESRYSQDSKRRFAADLARIASKCSDADETRVWYMVEFTHEELERAGLGEQEPMPELVDTLRQLTDEMCNVLGGSTIECSEVWAAYLVLRIKRGYSPINARRSIVAIRAALDARSGVNPWEIQ